MTALPRRLAYAGLVCGSLAVGLPNHAAAQSGAQVPQLTVGRPVNGDRPAIDGRVDDGVWSDVEPFSGFVQQEPSDGEPATERTEIRFLIDRGTLYIAVVCHDSTPDAIVVSQSRRDADLTETDSIPPGRTTLASVFTSNPKWIDSSDAPGAAVAKTAVHAPATAKSA